MSISGLDKQRAMLMLATDSGLTGAAKAVGCVLLDHYNLATGLCFPSIELIAVEANLADRSVRRALGDLKGAGWIDWDRHGGPGHTNLYSIDWQHYLSAKAAYEARQETHRAQYRQSDNPDQPVRVETENAPNPDNAVPQPGPTCPVNPDQPVRQTLEGTQERNREYLCSSFENEIGEGAHPSDSERVRESVIAQQGTEVPAGIEWTPYAPSRVRTKQTKKTPSPARVASEKAERRWKHEFNERFKGDKTEYARALEAITEEMRSAATAAEVKERGAGLCFLVEQIAGHSAQNELREPDLAVLMGERVG